MKLTIEVPENIGNSLLRQIGADLAQAAKEELAIAWYRAEKLSIGQVAELLGITVYEADGLMKRNNVESQYTVDDYYEDRATMKRLLGS